jgi:hypothetical protein
MKHVPLDKKGKQIKDFVRELSSDGNGCILELDGISLVQVTPIKKIRGDKAKLKKAILARRDESRKLNEDWQAVDLEMWEKIEQREKE